MLARLEIQDFALIDSASFDLMEGLTILTGETGAGKSILIDAIGAVSGNRVGKDMIRHGCECAVVTAVFEGDSLYAGNAVFDEAGIDTSETSMIITREIYQNGKTLARVNGRMIPITTLKEITRNLLDIHGQHENQAIFKQEMQSDLLDRFGGAPVQEAIRKFQERLKPYRECLHAIHEFDFDEAGKEQLIDILEFQIREIKTIHPKQNEDDLLAERRKIIANAEKIRKVLDESLYYLNGDSNEPALAAVTSAKNLVSHQLDHFIEYKEISSMLTEISYQMEEVCSKIRVEIDKVVVEPGELEEIDARLDQLFRLKKKYGGSIEAVLEFYKTATRKLDHIKSSEDKLKDLTAFREKCLEQLHLDALNIHNARIHAASLLEKRICEELDELGMKGTKFSVRIDFQKLSGSLQDNGSDQIEFLISPNIGEELKPLSRIASGGEASRIMLAIKTILAQSDQIPLLIFDEVDTGISGRTAGLLGEKLLSISATHQVLCVTHMAQIAAKANRHIYIEKNVVDNETKTSLKYLSEDQRIREIARLLSGGENEEKAMELAHGMIVSNRKTL